MARIITTENPSVDVRRFLRHWADQSFVEDRLREQHAGLGTERRRAKSRQVSRFVHQGLEFLANADKSPTITKALTLFYGAENLVKAACICRDEGLISKDIRLHGLGGEHQTKRYSVKNLSCRIYAPRKDVWSHVCKNFNCDRFRMRVVEGSGSFIRDQLHTYEVPPLKPPAQLQFGELVRHLPELADDVELAGWGSSYMVRADDLQVTREAGPPPKQSIRFKLRHGYRPGMRELILSRESNDLKELSRGFDQHDILEYVRDPTETDMLIPMTRSDVFGDLYMDLSRGRRALGELPVYVAALFILSDVVRYQAEHWLRLLQDHPAEEVVVERFLDIAGRKLPNLVLNELHQQIYEFKLAR